MTTSLPFLLIVLQTNNYLLTRGRGNGNEVFLPHVYKIIWPINIEEYYKKEIDDRQIIESFNVKIITDIFSKYNTFTKSELKKVGKRLN